MGAEDVDFKTLSQALAQFMHKAGLRVIGPARVGGAEDEEFTVKQQQRPVGAVLAVKAAGTVPAAIAGKPAPTDE
jgi:hypothetical protein